MILFNFKFLVKLKKVIKFKFFKKVVKKVGVKKGKFVFLYIKKLIDFKGMYYVMLFFLVLLEYFICRRFLY